MAKLSSLNLHQCIHVPDYSHSTSTCITTTTRIIMGTGDWGAQWEPSFDSSISRVPTSTKYEYQQGTPRYCPHCRLLRWRRRLPRMSLVNLLWLHAVVQSRLPHPRPCFYSTVRISLQLLASGNGYAGTEKKGSLTFCSTCFHATEFLEV